MLFLTGDHGEEFNEHGKRFHGNSLYQPGIQTASLLFIPGVAAARVRQPVTLTDIAPMLLNLARNRAGFAAM